MEDKEKNKSEELTPHPKDKSNFLTHNLFCWELPLIFKNYRNDNENLHLYKPIKGFESAQVGDEFEEHWQNEENFSKNPSMVRAAMKVFGLQYGFYASLMLVIEVTATILRTVMLQMLLDYYTSTTSKISRDEALLCASGLVLIFLFRILIVQSAMACLTFLSLKLSIGCSSLIYKHILNMDKSKLQKATVGQIINLLSNDVNQFDVALRFAPFIIIVPVEVVISVYYLLETLGYSSVVGLSVSVVCLLGFVYKLSAMVPVRKEVLHNTDRRVQLMNDVITGIKVIKMYTWEKPFEKLIKLVRKLESRGIEKFNVMFFFMNASNMFVLNVAMLACMTVAMLVGVPLTAQYVFVLFCMYEKVSAAITMAFPFALKQAIDVVTSLKRIQQFLLADRQNDSSSKIYTEKFQSCVVKSIKELTVKTVAIRIENASAKWNTSDHTLTNITFEAYLNELIGIVGASGSGKTTLLYLILKEIKPDRGSVNVQGTLSYASQEPWIFSASIKQNILFGEEMNEDKYLKVIKICALDHDLSLLSHGDQTLVGERGVMLSGGQKARINLARAIYRDADIYLLDDPLSAVDVRVGRHIFEECVEKYLKNKCVVLVTHQTHHLKRARRIYHLANGQIVASGMYEEMNLTEEVSMDEEGSSTDVVLNSNGLQQEVKEHRGQSTTANKAYRHYLCAVGGGSLAFISMAFVAIVVFMEMAIFCFLAVRVNWEQGVMEVAPWLETLLVSSHFLYTYAAFACVLIITTIVGTHLFAIFCKRTSNNLHNRLLAHVLKATMNFFNHHSSGRILNRFAKDIRIIDESIPIAFYYTMRFLLSLLAAVILTCILNYWMAIPTVAMLVVLYVFAQVFTKAIKSVTRTVSVTRSTMFSHVTATMQGLTTIRSLNAQKTLQQEFDHHQDLHISANYLSQAYYFTLGFWVDIICNIYMALVIFSFFVWESDDYTKYVGLVISQCINVMGVVQFGLKRFSDLDNYMTSVERVVEYTELETEGDHQNGSVPESWPKEGNITFKSVSLRYSPENPLVLKDLNFHLNGEEKIGIIGRTGAGKTSIASILFRLMDFEGTILIDGIDTKSVPLKKLRSKISMIPQDPMLFSGTIRRNLDPCEQFTDLQLWQALEEAGMKETISKLASGLEFIVSEGGSNFSVGQKQLLCLVRAMLQNNKIVVLDEATANVDSQADQLIQSTIKRKFQKCTVLTIAHRLNTVIDSDKILLIHDGQVVQFEEPQHLFQQPA